MPKVCRMRYTIFSLLDPFTHFRFLSSAENDSQLNIYWNAEQKCRKFTKFWSSIYFVYDLSAYAIGFFYSIYFIWIGQYDTSTWPRWFELPLPFDTASIWGWYLYFIGVTILDLMYMVFMISATTYFVGCCCYIEAMCEHIDRIVQTIQSDFSDYEQRKFNPHQCKVFDSQIMQQIEKIIGIQVEISE